jgi:ABC-type Zn2+ transport system substrate-binding protein/surface adhesin
VVPYRIKKKAQPKVILLNTTPTVEQLKDARRDGRYTQRQQDGRQHERKVHRRQDGRRDDQDHLHKKSKRDVMPKHEEYRPELVRSVSSLPVLQTQMASTLPPQPPLQPSHYELENDKAMLLLKMLVCMCDGAPMGDLVRRYESLHGSLGVLGEMYRL